MRHLVVIGTLLLGSVGLAEEPRSADEAAIKAVLTAIGSTWNTHDEAQVATLYTDDVTLMSPVTGRILRGKAAALRSFHMEHAGPKAIMLGTTWSGAIKSQRLGADWALVDVDADIANVKGPDGKVVPSRHTLIVALTKRSGKWLVSDLRPAFTRNAPAALDGTPLGKP